MGGGGYHEHGGGGGMRMGPPAGRGGGFGDTTNHRYNLTLSLMAANVLNHVNPAGYTGILTSPEFAQPTTLNSGFGGFGGGYAANNRRLEFQMRFTF
jgi:hypothetical protein